MAVKEQWQGVAPLTRGSRGHPHSKLGELAAAGTCLPDPPPGSASGYEARVAL